MEALDKISGIIGYAVVKAEDGSIEEVRGSSTVDIGDLTAFFSSAGEVIRDSLALGKVNFLSLCYGAYRLVIFPYDSKYIGVEVERERDPGDVIDQISTSVTAEEKKPEIELPRSINSKIQQINYLVEEFGGEDNKDHWLQLLNQGIGILGGEIRPVIGVLEGSLSFKEQPAEEKEDEYVQGLRSIIDFLVKKAVEEMGSSQARAKVQAVIERMK
jgi:hypothetical protein